LEDISYDDISVKNKKTKVAEKKEEAPRNARSPPRGNAREAIKNKSSEEHNLLGNLYSSFKNPIPDDKSRKVKFDIESYRYDNNKHYKTFIDENLKSRRITTNKVLPDGKVQNIYDNNVQEVIFPNGANRQTFPNGYSVVHFVNSDIKQTLPDGTIIYYYADHDTTQITLPKEKTEVS
jgi:hypothetical protein